KLLLCIEPLAAKAVKSAVAVEIDVAGFIHLSQQFLHIFDVVMIGGANEMIVSESTVIPGSPEGCADLVGKCFGVHPRLRGGLSDLVTMFVGAGSIVWAINERLCSSLSSADSCSIHASTSRLTSSDDPRVTA